MTTNKPIYHVVPLDDIYPHKESKDCLCYPKIEEDGKLIIHNSFDGREDYELGIRRPH